MFLKLDIEDVVEIVNNALRGLWASLCQVLYPWIAKLYTVFHNMGLIAFSDNYEVIYKNISMIIGIFMVFRVIFWLIEYLVSPEKMSDKEKGANKIVLKVFLSVILLATTPRIFQIAFEVQYDIVSEHIIEDILSNTEEEYTTEETGRRFSARLFMNFYKLNIENSECDKYPTEFGQNGEITQYGTIYEDMINEGNMAKLNNVCLTKKQSGEFVIDFNGIFAVAVGIFVFWMILMYCISLGARYIQMIFLQIIAPIPIMCYLTPNKDNMFNKWLKQCTTTYLDLFIRIAIINFVLLLSREILSDSNFITELLGNDTGFAAQLFIVLGLLMFAKKAPDLIQELLPKSLTKASGDFGLSWKKRTDAMVGGKAIYNATSGTVKRAPGFLIGGTAGMAVGATMGAIGGKGVGSRIAGGLSGAARGFATGSKKGNIFKNVGDVRKNQAAQNSKLQQWRLDAGKSDDEPNRMEDWVSRKRDNFAQSLGIETTGAYTKRVTTAGQDASKKASESRSYHEKKALEGTGAYVGVGTSNKSSIVDLQNRMTSATERYKSLDATKLVSTEEGRNQLKQTLIDNEINALKANGRHFTEEEEKQARESLSQEFNNMPFTEEQYTNAANSMILNAQKEMDIARIAFEDNQTESGFTEFIKRLGEKEQLELNTVESLNNFVEEYGKELDTDSLGIGKLNAEGLEDAYNLLTSNDNNVREYLTLNDKLESKETPETEKQEIARQMANIQGADEIQTAIDTYRVGLKTWKSYKALPSNVDKYSMGDKARIAQANDKYNGGK